MRRLLRLSFPVLLLLLSTLTATRSDATTMLARSVEDLARASQSVVRATTLSASAAWDAQRRIVTTVRLRALETLAGGIDSGAEFEVRHLGGVLDGLDMMVIGAPRFAPGEEVVLFLQRDPSGIFETVDLAQGKLEVVRDGAGRERLTRRDLESVEWAGGAGPGRVADLGALRARVTAARRLSR